MSEETKAESWVYTDDDTVAVNENLRKLPAEIRVYEVSGGGDAGRAAGGSSGRGSPRGGEGAR